MINLLIKRRAAGLSQKELGAIVGAAPNSICCWEKGSHAVRGDMLLKLAAALNCTPDELLGEQNTMSKFDQLQAAIENTVPQSPPPKTEDEEADALVALFFKLPQNKQKRLLSAMANYALNGIMPKDLTGIERLYFDVVCPHIQYVGGAE